MTRGRITSGPIRTRTFSDVLRSRGDRVPYPPREERSRTAEGRKPVVEIEDPSPSVSPDLKIEDVRLNVLVNSEDHHTNEYSISESGKHLIVRRGQTFDISIHTNREYKEKDTVKIVFLAGNNPTPPKETRISLLLSNKRNDKHWCAWILKNEDKKLSVRISTPSTCFVGIWKLQIDTIKKVDNKDVVFEYNHQQKIYILFNPWCKDDQVYHPKTTLLDEYILNENGKIYVGNQRSINGKKWNFGQFQENILDCAMYLLDTFMSSWSGRGDAVKISRKLSALANCQDEDGVLVGNWSGDYEGGKSPLHWIGSVAILQEYFKTKDPVSYGQCWVFSGITTTLCRTLGIPARSVTNFASAHDSDGSISIDNFWSDDGESMEELNSDSVWNFHVWNDVWMTRPDLPAGYGGWQAIDGTPQEASDYIYQCGPASLEAIKRGEVYLSYDAPFIFAEVNADRVNWKMDGNGDLENIGIRKHSIGHRISTKIPIGKPIGGFEFFCYDRHRQDVTNDYKYEEGSTEERAAVIKANQHSSTRKGLYDEGKKSDVQFELQDLDKIPYGGDISIALKMTNTSDTDRTISGCLCISSMYYTGIAGAKVKNLPIKDAKIKAKEAKEINLKLTFPEYYNKLVDQCHMRVSCMCHVKETNHTHVDQDTFRLIKPDLKVEAPEKGKVGEKMTSRISFTNPLPIALTECQLTVEGPGLQEPRVIRQSIVQSKQQFIETVDFVPTKTGQKELVASFNSEELAMVEGSCEITISE